MAAHSRRGASQVGKSGAGIVLQSVWTSVLITTFGVFERLIIYTGFALTIFTGLAVGAVIVLRLRYPKAGRPFQVPWYPWLPLAYLTATTWIALYTVWNRPRESVVGLLVVATGIPFYLLRGRPSPGSSPYSRRKTVEPLENNSFGGVAIKNDSG